MIFIPPHPIPQPHFMSAAPFGAQMLFTVSCTFFGLVPFDLTVVLLFDFIATLALLLLLWQCCCSERATPIGRPWGSPPPKSAPTGAPCPPGRDIVKRQRRPDSSQGGPETYPSRESPRPGQWQRRRTNQQRGAGVPRDQLTRPETRARPALGSEARPTPTHRLPEAMEGSERVPPGNYASAPSGILARGRAAMPMKGNVTEEHTPPTGTGSGT